MKIRILFKDPDAVSNAVFDQVSVDVRALKLHFDEREKVQELRMERSDKELSTWIRDSEYLEVEFDTEAGTATVLPARQ